MIIDGEELDRRTALKVLQDLSSKLRPQYDLFGREIFHIYRSDVEAIRKRYLDNKE